jgi:hypothetical protein
MVVESIGDTIPILRRPLDLFNIEDICMRP